MAKLLEDFIPISLGLSLLFLIMTNCSNCYNQWCNGHPCRCHLHVGDWGCVWHFTCPYKTIGYQAATWINTLLVLEKWLWVQDWVLNNCNLLIYIKGSYTSCALSPRSVHLTFPYTTIRYHSTTCILTLPFLVNSFQSQFLNF